MRNTIKGQILELLEEHGNLTHKHLNEMLPRISTESIGGQLSRLVKEGKITREGVARKYVYSLVNGDSPIPATQSCKGDPILHSIEDLISHCEKLAAENVKLKRELRDMKICIDRYGARIRQAKVIPLATNNDLDDD